MIFHYGVYKNPQTGPILIQLNSAFSLTSCFLHIVTYKGVTTEWAWIGEWIYWPLIHTTSNYSAVAKLHTLQIITAPAKPFFYQPFPGNGL
jgi:hypothetical protein